ncbi:hypothetical protein BT67DRAFT_12013 [Trichocladium antarcticum]|uniref:Uncharacterized protein n=1 Tax=Trichocladium antarcticum TaxID=1450529 RepID=A0AAN6USQ5_9PEZI|nr:hypothetical protein BT67DRAFT_12013 [Trichocladium antarcticum]
MYPAPTAERIPGPPGDRGLGDAIQEPARHHDLPVAQGLLATMTTLHPSAWSRAWSCQGHEFIFKAGPSHAFRRGHSNNHLRRGRTKTAPMVSIMNNLYHRPHQPINHSLHHGHQDHAY